MLQGHLVSVIDKSEARAFKIELEEQYLFPP